MRRLYKSETAHFEICCCTAMCCDLLVAGITPALAYEPTAEESGISTCAEEFCWYFRTRDGVREMRLWSITKGRWVTDWVPCPE